jgi:acetyl-CoA synthetase
VGGANIADYATTYAEFDWESARSQLEGLPGGGINIAHEAVDRHAEGPSSEVVALRWLGKGGERRDVSYGELARLTNRFANVLAGLDVAPGECVFGLTGRIPELYVAVLGTLKHRAVFSPLFSAFGPEPIATRIEKAPGTVLVTTERLYRRKVLKIRERLPSLRHVLLVDATTAPEEPGVHALPLLMETASDEYEIGETPPETMALLHFTSGTSGAPKAAVHVHEAVLAHRVTGAFALDLRPGDVFWCTTDPGWVTGTSYGIIAPLTLGVTNLIYEPEFDAERWYEVLERERVNVWYTAPTAVRMLMKVGAEALSGHEFPGLRVIASVGEPLNPEAIAWAEETLGMPILDNWWQSETGGIMVANYPGVPVRHGSMGQPMPGITVAIVHRDDDGVAQVVDAPDVQGELALRRGWPSMFRGYLHQDDRYARCFSGDWYLTGDLAKRDADGYLWFVGRADDVIKSAGHLIGPFEVESALVEHPDVVEAAVIGKPDDVAGAIVKAFISLRHGAEVDDALRKSVMAFARKRLGPAVAPREIDILDSLPKTRSGKIMRRLLRARELGLPEGDTSTLEVHS